MLKLAHILSLTYVMIGTLLKIKLRSVSKYHLHVRHFYDKGTVGTEN